ncbi:MAG: hypothetical protein P8X86_01320, partial [Desulfofustis sp.]
MRKVEPSEINRQAARILKLRRCLLLMYLIRAGHCNPIFLNSRRKEGDFEGQIKFCVPRASLPGPPASPHHPATAHFWMMCNQECGIYPGEAHI